MRCVLTSSSCVLFLATIASAGCPSGSFTVPGVSTCFKSFDGLFSWTGAKSKCLSEGLLLAKPSDSIASKLRKYLLDDSRDHHGGFHHKARSHWIDGRGSGVHMVWQRDSSILSPTNYLYRPRQETLVGTTDCLRLNVEEAGFKEYPFRPYDTAKCASNTGGLALCEGCPGGLFTVPGASKCFKSIDGPFSWTDAQSKCLSVGLLLAKPSDSIATNLREYLLKEARRLFGEGHKRRSHWVAGRGSGDHMVWQQDGTILRPTNHLYRPNHERKVATTDCLRIVVEEKALKEYPFRPYDADNCASNTGGHALCEDVVVPTCGRVNRGSGQGRKKRQTKIVGGVETEVNGYPWQVGLTMNIHSKSPICGGSIINERWILTAAHCVVGMPRIRIVVVGEHSWSIGSETDATRKHEIDKIVMHPLYNPKNNFDNDIALIELTKPLTFDPDNKVAPVCPPLPNEFYENVNAIVTGWGALLENGSSPDSLHEVVVPTMPNKECQSAYNDRDITDNMICAGLHEGGKDSCQGDSGGPMIIADGLIYRQIGVVSSGKGCARPDFPGIYTRVNNHLDWIRDIISGTRWIEP